MAVSFLRRCLVVATAILGAAGGLVGSASAFEPTKPITILVPAGLGGGAGQIATLIKDVVAKHQLAKQPIEIKSLTANSGSQAFLDVKNSPGDAHKLVITLSNLFTAPLAYGAGYSWRDLTPVTMLALDQFVLWVEAEAPYTSAIDLMGSVRKGQDRAYKLGGTGQRQEDELISIALERYTTPNRVTYVPYSGGGEVAAKLADKTVQLTVNNPIEGLKLWQAGKIRPLCLFSSERIKDKLKVTADFAWSDVPTCIQAGLALDYKMMRAVFMAPGVTPAQIKYYDDLLAAVRKTPEWKAYVQQGALIEAVPNGPELLTWLGREEDRHYLLMSYGGLVAPTMMRFGKQPPQPAKQ